MTFSDCIPALLEGKVVRRNDPFLSVLISDYGVARCSSPKGYPYSHGIQLTRDDLTATDWEIVEDVTP